MHNQDIRNKAKELNIYMYELADYMQVHENTLYRLLRKELPSKEKENMLNVLEKLMAEKAAIK